MKNQRKGGFLISKIHQLSGRVFTRMLRERRLDMINTAQGRIMFPLWRQDGISIVDLTRETALTKSTLTSMLDRLEEAKYLQRVPSTTDRRKIEVHLTDEGRRLQEEYSGLSQEMAELFYEGFSSSEIDEFERCLERLLQNLLKHS